MAKQPFFSVIITNKNAFKWLKKCFTSLENQTFKNFEVVFVDNVSTDGSTEYVEKTFPWVRVIRNKKDMGFAGANNVGGFAAKGVYLILMNTDAYMDKDTLQNLAAVIKKNPNYHFMQLDVRHYEKDNMDDKPVMFSMDPFGYPIGYGRMFYADGAALVIRRDLFKKLRGFDNEFYMYLEDLDLAWRARMLGEDIHFLKGVYIYHYTGGTSVSTLIKNNSYTTTTRRRYHAQKNNLRMLLKNYSFINLLWAFPFSMLLASAEGWLYLTKKNTEGFVSLHKAIWWNLIYLPDTWVERKKVQKIRKVSDSIIFGYIEKTVSKLYSYKLHGVPSMK